MKFRSNCAPSFTPCVRSLLVPLVFYQIGFLNYAPSLAVTPQSPEVRQVVDRALRYLESNTDQRLGGRCLIGLAFYKTGAAPDHPRIQDAVKACQAATPEALRQESLYSNALAIIFLSELDPVKYRSEIDTFASVLESRQKGHGGWGYDAYESGDTSQTQYAVLTYWELMQIGRPPQVGSVEKAANWLLRTQDPSGAWGYQGQDPGNFSLKPQQEISVSMVAAGLGSTLICANILGVLQPGVSNSDKPEDADSGSDLPDALKVVQSSQTHKIKSLSGGTLDREQLLKAIASGKKWFEDNFSKFEVAEYPFYLLYSVERYKSFEDFLSGTVVEEPEWYQTGFEYVRRVQRTDGSLRSMAGSPCATAFAVLFLVRSTQQSIKASLGEGTLVGGRGLSANLARMKLKNGRLVTERRPTQVDEFLQALDDTSGGEFDALMQDTATIDVANVRPEQARRLEQLVRTGSPAARLLAVEALSKLRDLDYVPSLLYALTDPDKRVVRAARDGLRYVSRRFEGYGLPDNFTETQQYDALEAWKNWYRRVRPNAPVR